MQSNSNSEDRDLLHSMKEGDVRALGKLYDKYWMQLLSIAMNRLNGAGEAEECVQDVFIGIWKRRDSLTITQSFNAYLSTAIKNQVYNRLAQRYTKKNNLQLGLQSEIAYETADSALLTKDLSELIDQAVSTLPKKCQIVYLMSRQEGISNKDIAKKLNISEKTVEGHITKALQAIRKYLPSGSSLFTVTALEWYIRFKLKI